MARKMYGLDFAYEGTLFSLPRIPRGISGTYTVTAGFVPKGARPAIENAVYQYYAQAQVIVQ